MPKHPKKHKKFIDAIVDLAGEHEAAAADFFLVKKSDLAEVLGPAAGPVGGNCVLWAVNPATGELVCLKTG
jgi:hypothetical protein